MSRCGACGRTPSKQPRGAARKCCPTERCEAIYYSGHQRRKCARCRSRLPRGRRHQRNAICATCFVDLCDVMGLATTGPHAANRLMRNPKGARQ